MKPIQIVMLIFSGLFLSIGQARGQVSRAVRESAEYVITKFGTKAAGETVEGVSKKIATAVTKYGDETIPAFTKVGAPAFAAAEEAAEFAAPKLKLMARQGSDALWVTADPKKMAIFIKNGDEAADAMLKHKGIADTVLEKWGGAAAKPLNQVSTANAKRIAIMTADGDLAKIGKTDELFAVVGKYGDSAMDFIWRNKFALLVGANLVAFLSNPQPYIDGTLKLAEVASQPVSAATSKLAEGAAKNTNWTVVILFAMSLLALGFGYFIWSRKAKIPEVAGVVPDQKLPDVSPNKQIKI